MDGLASLVRSWARRAKLQRSVWWLFFGLAAGLATALLIAIAARVWPLMGLPTLITLSVGLAVLGVLSALAWPWIRGLRIPLLTWSRIFDQQFGLRQRVSTAIEANDGTLNIKNDAIRMRLQQDAARIADTVDARKLLPLRLSWRAAATSLALLAALALTLALPNAQQQALAAQEQFQKNLEQQVQQIEQAKQQIQQSKALTDAQKEQALKALDEAKQALSDPNATPEKALAAINDAQSKLDAMRDQEAQQRNADLENAGESLSADQLTNALANALQNQNFEQAAQQMRNMATQQQGAQQGQSLTPDEAQRTADQLDQMARQVQASDPAMAQQLREAAQHMREGNTEAAQQSLDKAAQSLDRAQQTQQANQSLQQAQAQTEAARQSVAQASQQAQQQAQQQSQQTGANQASQNPDNQANQSGQSQPGQPDPNAQQANGQQAGPAQGEGQAEQPGQAGQSGMPGAVQSGAPGEGSSGSISQGGVAEGSSQQSGHSEDTGSDNSVYAPGRVKNQGEQVVLEDPQGEVVPDPNGPKNTAAEGQSTVPYQDVYGDYAKSADDAIQNDEVPPELRDYVRDYFSSLDPKSTR